jgi:hypothetical protein
MNEPKKITREELYERIWQMPATKLAKELGISDVALAKICRKINVPKPGPGHWRLVQLGWEIEKTPLPALDKRAAGEAVVDAEHYRRKKGSGVDQEGAQGSKQQYEVVPVPETLHGAHPLVTKVRRSLEAEKPGRSGIIDVPWKLRVFDVSVSRAQMGRALRIMDALVKALGRRGAVFVEPEKSECEFVSLRIDGEQVGFDLEEQVDKREREPKDEEERQSWSWKWDRWEVKANGKLRFRILASEPKGARKSWKDCTFYDLEGKVGEIVEWIFVAGDGQKRARVAWEEAVRKREEEWKRQEEERRRQEEARALAEQKRLIEEGNRSRLEAKARAWREARVLRRFSKGDEQYLDKPSAGHTMEKRVAFLSGE